jgi:hypothetical protein
MGKHTPGPWTVYEAGFSVADAWGHVLSTDVEGRMPEEAAANARLIAAAPELLAALEALLSVYQGFAPWEGEVERQAEIKARAAIAKARGE